MATTLPLSLAPHQRTRNAASMGGMNAESERKVLARNRRASYEYHIVETFEAGVVLSGSEVKSAKAGGAHLTEGYVRIEAGQAWLWQVRITPYSHGGTDRTDPEQRRRLLLHKREIVGLGSMVQTAGLTIVPLELFQRGRTIKVIIALVRGKKLWDKRQAIATKDAKRDSDREMARHRQG